MAKTSGVFGTLIGVLLFTTCACAQAAVIIDHRHTDIRAIPQQAIEQAKSTLHIAYGHTSHGSQLTSGMTGLVGFANNGGLGLSLPEDIFAWNNGGSDGALDLHDYAMADDVGYYPQWVNETRAYLNDPANSDVNVIIWSWCGQVDDKYSAGTLESEYLTPMSQLETDYPDVTFVYMTGHVDIFDDADNKAANEMIRTYCLAHNKVLYDFADIERYDPDDTYYEFVHDTCDYYDSAGGAKLGNWATEWQASHAEGVDWYDCSSAHSEALNANQKAYAAWHLWARLGGWNPGGPAAGVTIEESGGTTAVAEGGATDTYSLVLDSQPAATVDVTITPDSQVDVGGGEGGTVILTFTTANWDTPQIVTVAAVDDAVAENRHDGIIRHSVSSSDTAYNGIDIPDIKVTIIDNDQQNHMLLQLIPLLIGSHSGE